MEREREKAASMGTVQSLKEQFGTGKPVPASWGKCNMSGCICFLFYKYDKIEGTF